MAPEACSSLLWLEEEVLGGLVKGERTRPGSQFIVLADVEGAKGLLRGPESCVGVWSRLSQTLIVSHVGLAQGVPLMRGGSFRSSSGSMDNHTSLSLGSKYTVRPSLVRTGTSTPMLTRLVSSESWAF